MKNYETIIDSILKCYASCQVWWIQIDHPEKDGVYQAEHCDGYFDSKEDAINAEVKWLKSEAEK